MKMAHTPYHPHAPRNRLPEHFKGEARPMVRFCQARNVSDHALLYGHLEAGYERFRTTQQNYFDYDTKPMVGETNQGIVSDTSKKIHTQQAM